MTNGEKTEKWINENLESENEIIRKVAQNNGKVWVKSHDSILYGHVIETYNYGLIASVGYLIDRRELLTLNSFNNSWGINEYTNYYFYYKDNDDKIKSLFIMEKNKENAIDTFRKLCTKKYEIIRIEEEN